MVKNKSDIDNVIDTTTFIIPYAGSSALAIPYGKYVDFDFFFFFNKTAFCIKFLCIFAHSKIKTDEIYKTV